MSKLGYRTDGSDANQPVRWIKEICPFCSFGRKTAEHHETCPNYAAPPAAQIMETQENTNG